MCIPWILHKEIFSQFKDFYSNTVNFFLLTKIQICLQRMDIKKKLSSLNLQLILADGVHGIKNSPELSL